MDNIAEVCNEVFKKFCNSEKDLSRYMKRKEIFEFLHEKYPSDAEYMWKVIKRIPDKKKKEKPNSVSKDNNALDYAKNYGRGINNSDQNSYPLPVFSRI
ncbi:hypothetical protein JW851_02505 [Candidatus Woesearchaeota archaeon]|nr:hypothetical protein [Candidatus Woesearchaeota archaeon]